jgi:hypothetical protein
MVYPFDVTTKAELTNSSITENGFYLDLANSRYLDINIKKEVLKEGAEGLTEDIRFNKPAKDGDQYTEEGIFTITVSNRYTDQLTTKTIYVGANKVLKAFVTTGLSIKEINNLVSKGAEIADDGTISQASTQTSTEEAVITTVPVNQDIDTDEAISTDTAPASTANVPASESLETADDNINQSFDYIIIIAVIFIIAIIVGIILYKRKRGVE